jgi:two-component system, NtrC family, response regulator HydG
MSGLKILVVDDDIDNAHSLGELFELEGHCPMVVHSGEAAIEAYMDRNFDLAFMDVMMPGLNGVDSFLAIRKLRPSAKVFMMTGYSVEELLRQAISHGAMGVLNKPMDSRALLNMIAQVGQNGLVVSPGFGKHYGQHLRQMIHSSGFECSVVNDGTAHLAAGKNDELIILDLNLSLIDSVAYYSNIRKSTQLPPTIIVTPSTGNLTEGYDAMRDLVVTGILNKPFDPLDLLTRLETLAA